MESNLPKDEELYDDFYDKNGVLKYAITCKSNGKYWYLYKNTGKKVKRIKGASSYEELSKLVPNEF